VEEWAPIPGFSAYMISSEGRVQNVGTGRIIKQSNNGRGVPYVCLRSDAHETKVCAISKLVAEAFLGLGPRSHQVWHADRNTYNNSVDNLSWRSRRFIMRAGNQDRRTSAIDDRKIRDRLTGQVYPNALEAAKMLDLLEEDILWGAEDPLTRKVSGRGFEFLYSL
jgi:hypothetical protein